MHARYKFIMLNTLIIYLLMRIFVPVSAQTKSLDEKEEYFRKALYGDKKNKKEINKNDDTKSININHNCKNSQNTTTPSTDSALQFNNFEDRLNNLFTLLIAFFLIKAILKGMFSSKKKKNEDNWMDGAWFHDHHKKM